MSLNFKIIQRKRRNQKSFPAFIILSPPLVTPLLVWTTPLSTQATPTRLPCLLAITHLPDKILAIKLASNVPNNITRNPRLCSFVSFSIVWVTPCLIDIISAAVTEHYVSYLTSTADAATVDLDGINTLWAKIGYTNMAWMHSSSMAIRLSLTVQEACQVIYLIALFWILAFLILLYSPINHLQKPCKEFRLANLIVNYVEH